MSDDLAIEWHGCDGSVWHVSGDDRVEEEGVLLLPKPTRLIDAPVETYWVKSGLRQLYQDFSYTRRDPVLGFQVWGDGDALSWRDIDSRFRLSWDYGTEGQLVFITNDSVRRLGLRLLSEPTAYEGEVEQGRDPHLFSDATVVISAAGEDPLYVGDTVTQDFVVQSSSGSRQFMVENDGDVDMWLRWTVSATNNNCRYTFPDYSWGSTDYLRASADAARTWQSPLLRAGEHTSFDSDPREEFALSNIDTNVWNRCDGNWLRYPVPKHTKPTPVTVSWAGCVAGDSIRLSYTKRYSRPWGVSFYRDDA